MTYEDALKTAKKAGASKAEGLPLLAQTVATLALEHAISRRGSYL